MNLPNLLTLSRLAAIPLLMALLLLRFPGHDQLAAALFVAFSFTDTLDGQIARRRGMVSDLGKFLDPLADKLLVLSVLIVLVQEGLVAAWVVVVIFSRELLITILRSVGASQGRVIAAAPLGKTKTVTQMAAVALLILQRPYPELVPIAALAVAVAVVFTIVSGIDYLVRFRHLIGLGAGASRSQPQVDPLAEELGATLAREGLTVSVAESATGGMLGALITDRPGSSTYFLGGVIAYGDEAKRDELGVPAALLKRHGAVSREVADHGHRGSGLRRLRQAGRAHVHRDRIGVGEALRGVHVHRRPLVEPQAGFNPGAAAAPRGGPGGRRPAKEQACMKALDRRTLVRLNFHNGLLLRRR